MKRNFLAAFAAVALVAGFASCSGRTQENMTPDSDTVEAENFELPGMDTGKTISAGEVDMNADPQTGVIADSPAEAAAQANDSNSSK